MLFDKAEFERWGWRVPFWLSLVLVVFSFVLRMRLQESPLFQKIKASGKASVNPLRESFTKWPNLKMVLIALFGAAAGQGVVWYTGQFYGVAFMQKTLMIEFKQSNYIIAPALGLLATPFFIFWGAMSDRWGRKWIMLAGCLIALDVSADLSPDGRDRVAGEQAARDQRRRTGGRAGYGEDGTDRQGERCGRG